MLSSTRLRATRVICDILHGKSLTDALPKVLTDCNAKDRAFIQALCYGVCRFYPRLASILRQLMSKPLKSKDSDVYALLLIGIYQLMDMRVPPHAAVTETVNVANALKKPWARGLVNAVLREYLRTCDKLDLNDLESIYCHPKWWIEVLKTAWPNDWELILNANNEHPPMMLRVNEQKIHRSAYLQKLTEKEIAADAVLHTISGIKLQHALPVEELPGFAEGEISVQDAAAQLAAPLLELKPGYYVLDACAAPGGKLMHILELEPKLAACIAIEKDSQRILSIYDNLARLKLQAECICDNALNASKLWPPQTFDRILLDAPCSASGVIRRHPDIKLLRKKEDIFELTKLQLALLNTLWPLLKPDGLLLYATCSIFPQENEEIIRHFLLNHQDAVEDPLNVEWGISCTHGRQIFPGMLDMDGFYYARLRKTK